MARYGRGEEGALQAAAVEHMVPMEGWTALDARWLELRQRLLRIQKKSSDIMEQLQEAQVESQMMDLATGPGSV